MVPERAEEEDEKDCAPVRRFGSADTFLRPHLRLGQQIRLAAEGVDDTTSSRHESPRSSGSQGISEQALRREQTQTNLFTIFARRRSADGVNL